MTSSIKTNNQKIINNHAVCKDGVFSTKFAGSSLSRNYLNIKLRLASIINATSTLNYAVSDLRPRRVYKLKPNPCIDILK